MCRFGRFLGDVVVLGQTHLAFELSVLKRLYRIEGL